MVRSLPTSAPNPSNATRIGIFFKDLGNEQTPGPRFSKDIIRTVLINFDITFEDIFFSPKLSVVSQTFPTKSTMELMGWNNDNWKLLHSWVAGGTERGGDKPKNHLIPKIRVG